MFQAIKDKFKKVHFIGIGGIGMSAIAKILHEIGICVQGSDIRRNDNINDLEKLGIKCFVPHEAKNISEDIDLVVTSSVINENNIEYITAHKQSISIISRAELLAKLMKEKKSISIAGTHGKTSSTAMVGILLEVALKDPTIINGGTINYFKNNAKFGNGDYLVAESDESDGSFIFLPTFIGAITNIEAEHLEFYDDDFNKAKEYYYKYSKNIPQNGLLALGIDDIEVKNLYKKISNQKNITTYGIDPNSDIVAQNIIYDINGCHFDVFIRKANKLIKNIFLPLYGQHNVINSLIAIAIADFFQFSDALIKDAFSKFTGVKKRFTKIAQINGISIFDDYAHHPTEIKATLCAARYIAKNSKVIAIFEPHKHSRVKNLFNEFCNCFADADIILVTDIYKVGKEIAGIDKNVLAKGISQNSDKNVIKLNNVNEISGIIKTIARKGDLVIFLGAGNSSLWANEIINFL